MSDSNPPPYSEMETDSKPSEPLYPVQEPNKSKQAKGEGEAVPAPPLTCGAIGCGPDLPSVLEAERVKRGSVKYLSYVPVLHIGLVGTLFVFNCIIPGLGTLIAGLLFPCVGHTVMQEASRWRVVGLSLLFALAQLITSGITIGYIFAVFWSYGTVAASRMYYQRPVREDELVDSAPSMIN